MNFRARGKPAWTMARDDPVAYFLTWPTYGSWLPGDDRGWVERGHGWQLPAPAVELEARARMTANACLLTPEQRAIVEHQIAETCRLRGWTLHAVSCRSNHVHVVVGALGVPPSKVRGDLKAWTSRRLRALSDPARERWWAERGSQRQVHDSRGLEAVIDYVRDAQDRKERDATP